MRFYTLLLKSLFATGTKQYGLSAFNIFTSGSFCSYCSHSSMITLPPNHILTMYSLRSGPAEVPLISIPAQRRYFYIVSLYVPETDIYFCLLCNINTERANIFFFLVVGKRRKERLEKITAWTLQLLQNCLLWRSLGGLQDKCLYTSLFLVYIHSTCMEQCWAEKLSHRSSFHPRTQGQKKFLQQLSWVPSYCHLLLLSFSKVLC